MTIRNEPIRLQSVTKSSPADREQLLAVLTSLMEREQNLVPV